MNPVVYLKPWLENWKFGHWLVLLLILLSGIVQFVSFSLNQNYMISYLGAQPEDITFALQMTYVGIITTLPVLFRFLRYFEIKYYLMCITILGIILGISCLYTTDLNLFFIIRFLQGIVVGSIAGSSLILISSTLSLEIRMPVGASVFYGTLLSSAVLIGVVASHVSMNADFNNIFLYLLIFQVFILAIILICFNGRSGLRPYPLWQIDWIGDVFFATALAGLTYTLIYGSKYYWFNDQRIKLSALFTISAALLFIYRGLTAKRPLIDLSVFRFRKFWIAFTLLALFYGLKDSINLIYAYTSQELHWSPTHIMTLGLCNITGLITFTIISAQILERNKAAIFQFLLAGFSMLFIYHLWMYFIFTPDLSFGDLVLPIFFQGAASGILFVPIMIFTLTSVPQTTGMAALILAACTRCTSQLNSGAGFYNLQLYYNQLFKESFLYHLTNIDQQIQERLNDLNQFYLSRGFSPDEATAMANGSLSKALGIQTQILTDRAIFLFMAVIIVIILVGVLMTYLYRTYLLNRQKERALLSG